MTPDSAATPPAAEVRQLALVVAPVEFRQGDGAMLRVPVGEIEVVTTPADATLAWQEGETRGSATMPLADFRRHVDRGLIRLKPAGRASESSPDSYP
jgi:hypothetical protein